MVQVLIVYRPELAQPGETPGSNPLGCVEVFGLYPPDAVLVPVIDKLITDHPAWEFLIDSAEVKL